MKSTKFVDNSTINAETLENFTTIAYRVYFSEERNLSLDEKKTLKSNKFFCFIFSFVHNSSCIEIDEIQTTANFNDNLISKTYLHWFMLSEKFMLNNLSFAKAFCRKVSGCVIAASKGFTFTIDPGPVSLPSLRDECPLAPESRL